MCDEFTAHGLWSGLVDDLFANISQDVRHTSEREKNDSVSTAVCSRGEAQIRNRIPEAGRQSADWRNLRGVGKGS